MNVNLKRFGVVFGLIALLSVPTLVAAQGGYPSGGGSMGGGIQVGGGDGGNGGGDVMIVDFAYDPSAIFVSPGATVTWYNAGDTAHTVDSNSEVFESPTLNPGSDYSVTFDNAGFYPYHCDFHPNMTGMVIVSGI
jgi:plastocyanin